MYAPLDVMREQVWLQSLGVGRFIVLRQTAYLFIVDLAANMVDYAYHVYLGRALIPGDFALFQTLNSALLIFITAAGVMQPVVARFVAESESGGDGRWTGALTGKSAAIVRAFLRWSILAGFSLVAIIWLGRGVLSRGLNIPVYAVQLGAVVIFMVLLRPVVAGALQGGQRFVGFGVVRFTYAIGRFAVAGILLYLGWGLLGAVVSLPAGQLLAVGVGVGLIGTGILAKAQPTGGIHIQDWLPLAGWAFLSYAAHAALLNMDMLFVNQFFTSDEAGIYAAGVLLRRILLLLPAAAVVVLYPRVASGVAAKKLPDREIIWAAGLVSGLMAALVGIYFVAGESVVRLVFGEAYAAVGPFLGWIGLGIWGYSLGTIWMNVFLATRPGPYAGLLWLLVGLQGAGILAYRGTLSGVVAVFFVIGWALALAGGILYIAWLRPRLVRQFTRAVDE